MDLHAGPSATDPPKGSSEIPSKMGIGLQIIGNPNFNPQFVKQHYLATSTNMTHQQLICPILGEPFKMASCSVKPIFRYPPTPFNVTCFNMGDKFHILGSCHGLLWLFSVGLRCMKLCNLAMGTITSKTFPSPNLRYSATFCGFDYDHLNDKYKLFLVVDSETETSAFGTNVEENPRKMTNIFTFGTNVKATSWKVIQDFPCDADAANDFYGKFVSGTGTLNWPVEKTESDVILSFDLASETYGEVLLPDGVSNMINIPQLVILSNCLSVSFFDFEKDHLVLWQMKEYGVQHSWTRLMVFGAIPFAVEGGLQIMENPNFEPQFVKQHHLSTSAKMTHRQLVSPIFGQTFKMASCFVQPLFQDPSTLANATCFLQLLCLLNVHLDIVQLLNPLHENCIQSVSNCAQNPSCHHELRIQCETSAMIEVYSETIYVMPKEIDEVRPLCGVLNQGFLGVVHCICIV
ncbi:hypothetical protein Fmac_014343 [Flemingia macrophylla]|uniref:F-box associated beta-propeller type 3 domain-containing protein n=1 Tax=Flemingia macrophylla TaxID=520843 RepID=A0ABD1MBG1_9FABA